MVIIHIYNRKIDTRRAKYPFLLSFSFSSRGNKARNIWKCINENRIQDNDNETRHRNEKKSLKIHFQLPFPLTFPTPSLQPSMCRSFPSCSISVRRISPDPCLLIGTQLPPNLRSPIFPSFLLYLLSLANPVRFTEISYPHCVSGDSCKLTDDLTTRRGEYEKHT